MWDHNLCNLVAKPLNLNVLDDQRRVLLDRTEVTVGARAFDVLAYLFAHTDRTVSKAELLDHIWSGLIVEKGNLSVQIAGLRKAIDTHFKQRQESEAEITRLNDISEELHLLSDHGLSFLDLQGFEYLYARCGLIGRGAL